MAAQNIDERRDDIWLSLFCPFPVGGGRESKECLHFVLRVWRKKKKSWRSTVIWFRCIKEEGGTYLLISFLTGETRTENRSWSPTGISSFFTPYFCPGLDPPDSHTRCFCFLISLSGLASIQRLGRIVMRRDGIPGCARGGWGEINKQPNKQINK